MRFLFWSIVLLSMSFLQAEPHKNNSLNHCVYLHKPGGRLGDHLISYIKAKYLAYNNDLPLFIKPGKYFKLFKISDNEAFLDEPPYSDKHKAIKNGFVNLQSFAYKNPTNFLVSLHNTLHPKVLNSLREKEEFRAEVLSNIAAKEELPLIFPPPNVLSVALHVRTGKGFDKPMLTQQYYDLSGKITHTPRRTSAMKAKFSDVRYPGRFLPEKFYGDAVKYLSDHLNNPKLYVYIFTDDPDPVSLKDRLSSYISRSNITLDCAPLDREKKRSVLIDFFSIGNFDYFIRSDLSNFALVAEFISDHKIVLSSAHQHWVADDQGHYLIVDAIDLKVDQNYSRHSFMRMQ